MNEFDYQKAVAEARDDREDKCVKQALELIDATLSEKRQKDDDNRQIIDLMREGFSVQEPNGARKITSQMLHQSMWRTMNKMKPLDYQLHATNRPEYMEQIVTYGMGSILERARLAETLRDKQGVFWNQLLFGDGFYLFNANPTKNDIAPLVIRTIQNSNVYVDPYATSIRSPGYGRSATECLIIFSTSWAEAIKIWPKLKRVGGPGEIPREVNRVNRETGQTYEQTVRQDTKTEIAMYFNISEKKYVVFAGEKCTVLTKEMGNNYPFVHDDEPYIPVGQFMAIPSADGFYNNGLGSLLYRLSVVSRQLFNMAIGHAEDSVYPITLVDVPAGESAKFFNDLQNAHRMRATGKKGYVAMEYDPNNPGAGRAGATSLLTQSMINEYQFIYEQISREIRRCGINLDDIEKGPNITATQIIAEEENSNAFVKQISEYNASEWKFLLDVTMQLATKFISTRNKTLIDMPTRVNVADPGQEKQEVAMSAFTYGDIVSEIKENNYFVSVNSRSGAYPSNVMQQAQISRMMAVTPPGTKAYFEMMRQLASVNDRDFTVEDFMPEAPPQPEPGPAPPEEAMMTETDRLTVAPDAMERPEPAF